MPIRQLAPDVAAKIAAGEVVERPASVVKELIENSIDAGATQIRVDLMNGGLQLIRVTDNGCGISPEELPLALERHATSKVTSIDDLEQIRSLGFRGEALASIAAVAEVTLMSRARGSEQGSQVSAQSGHISDVTPAASPEGTTITVRNLFSAVPARLKFLKSRNTEISHCHHLLEQYALAYPEIRFTVASEGKQIFSTPGDGKLFSVLVQVYGLQIAEQMVEVDGDDEHDASDGEYPIVKGFVSRPACYKSTRQHISFFVNRRWVMSRMLTTAVEGAYHSLLLSGRHPLAVINIQIDPSFLDVNVHPAKTEIRFLKERRVFAAILRAARKALLQEPEMPQWKSKSSEPRASSQPDAYDQEPSFEGRLDLDEETVQAGEQEAEEAGKPQQRQSTIPGDSPWITFTEEEHGTRPPGHARLWQSHLGVTDKAKGSRLKAVDTTVEVERSPTGTLHAQAEQVSVTLDTSLEEDDPLSMLPPATPVEKRPEAGGDIAEQEPLASFDAVPRGIPTMGIQLPSAQTEERSRLVVSPVAPQVIAGDAQRVERRPEQGALPGHSIDPNLPRKFPRLRVVGQLSQSYIVTEGPDGMYLIDQHAAHERIVLERMVAALKSRETISQLLLTPMHLTLAPVEIEALEEHGEQLRRIGFELEVVDGKTVEVRAVPTVLVKRLDSVSLHALLVELTAEDQLGHTETWEERALANVACKAAIKQNYFLAMSEMREMLEQLEQVKAPFSCCHGRPTMVHFSLAELAHEFDRR
ncbi:hypothetical protein KSD_31580 [Ktedonobacter sp. SOSP1-85]|uniref:DNA mismatch repair endonuclease MutL n=1 Tax=Ktedonobacter sp. SOSP1-85 TaxID=2778367 RepID=UPI001916AA01|nr:DNA mismatch repair endonuclease MutL [Ktedonobacter sp. SOSP1-85]GHO75387.1 hypothetical protein KSD_31580 [Ktedonobacter sp. SOSP1-85]